MRKDHVYDIMWGYNTPKGKRSYSNVDSATYPLVKKGHLKEHHIIHKYGKGCHLPKHGRMYPYQQKGEGLFGDILTGGVKLLPDLIKAIPGITGMFKKAPHDEKQRINNEILKRINETNDPKEKELLYKLLKH
jgi:hypothetical protein